MSKALSVTLCLLLLYSWNACGRERPRPAAPDWVAALPECTGRDDEMRTRVTKDGCQVRKYRPTRQIIFYQFDVWWKNDKPLCFIYAGRDRMFSRPHGTPEGEIDVTSSPFDQCLQAYHRNIEKLVALRAREKLEKELKSGMPAATANEPGGKVPQADVQVRPNRQRNAGQTVNTNAPTSGNAMSFLTSGSGLAPHCKGTGASFQVINRHNSRAISAKLKVSYRPLHEEVSSTYDIRLNPGEKHDMCTYVACDYVTTGCGFYKSYSVLTAAFAN